MYVNKENNRLGYRFGADVVVVLLQLLQMGRQDATRG